MNEQLKAKILKEFDEKCMREWDIPSIEWKQIATFLEQAMEQSYKEGQKSKDDLLEEMWGIICNVSGSDWTKQNEMWQEAAKKAREKYFNLPLEDGKKI